MSKRTDSVAPANESTLSLIAQYHAAKSRESEAASEAKALRSRVIDALNGADADQFTDADGEVVVSRVHKTRRSLDAAIVQRLASKTYQRALKVTEYESIDLPRIVKR